MTKNYISDVHDVIEDIRCGKMVIVVDDEDRENEGDLIVAAELVTPEHINFMATHGRGLVCLPMTADRAAQLQLPLMCDKNEDGFGTKFTVSVDARHGVTTGISAYDRAHTIRTAVRADAVPSDLARPGHVFPLIAEPGGVLKRRGHTEAACDLARLAGLAPAGVICEIMSPDGQMARLPELALFARRHHLRIGTIADLCSYVAESKWQCRGRCQAKSNSSHQGPVGCPLCRAEVLSDEFEPVSARAG